MSLYEVYMGGVKVNMGVYMGERMGCFGGENGGLRDGWRLMERRALNEGRMKKRGGLMAAFFVASLKIFFDKIFYIAVI